MPHQQKPPNKAIAQLADVATMYILDCMLDDVTPPDEAFRRYLQSCDSYWELGDAFSTSLLDSELRIQDSVQGSICHQIIDAVPHHHQYVADDFVERFTSRLASMSSDHPAWVAFCLYSRCRLRFIDRFLGHAKQIRIPGADALDSTGAALRRAVESAVRGRGEHIDQDSVRAAFASLECDQLWDTYVSAGVRRFRAECESA